MGSSVPKEWQIGIVGKARASVDDVARAFNKAGATCRRFGDGKSFLQFLENESLDAICLFTTLSDMHWLTFLRTLRVREAADPVPAILIVEDSKTLDSKEQELLTSYNVVGVVPLSAGMPQLITATRAILNDAADSESPESQLRTAKELYQQGMVARARQIYEEIVKDDKNNLVARAGLVFTGRGDQAELMKQLSYVLEADPENYNYKFELMRYFVTHGDHDRFKALFDEVMGEIETSHEFFWLTQLGEVCLSLSLTTFCDKIVEVMLRHPENAAGWRPFLLQARIAIANGELERAGEYLTRAEAVSSEERAEILNMRGIIKRKEGLPEEALELFRKAQSLADYDHRIAFNIALCHRNLRQSSEAIASLEKAISLCPTYERARQLLDTIRANS